jgi:hypothetical protein
MMIIKQRQEGNAKKRQKETEKAKKNKSAVTGI